MTTVLFVGEIGVDHREHIKQLTADIFGVKAIFHPTIDEKALELASRADVLVSGHPTDELLGPDGLLVNVARGKLVNEHGLYTALKDKVIAGAVIAGAALDVGYDCRPQQDSQGRKYPYELHPFHELSNVVLSPHRGALPIFSLDRWDEVVGNIRRFVAGQELTNVVDLEQGIDLCMVTRSGSRRFEIW